MSKQRNGLQPGWTFLLGAVFGAGVVLGTTFDRVGWAPQAEVIPVKGVDSDALALEQAPVSSASFGAAVPNTAVDMAGVPRPRAGSDELPARQIAREAARSTAYIRGGNVYGAGIVIGPNHVLTCLHVVEEMATIQVSIAKGPMKPAKLVDRDRELDLAILHVDTSNTPSARFASVTAVEVGDPMYAMGAPRKMSFSLTRGIASYSGRPYDGVYYLQTDIPTNGGSSGGPVLDARGHVVAISSFILRDSQGLSFALPIDYARQRFGQYFDSQLDLAPFDGWLATNRSLDSEHPR